MYNSTLALKKLFGVPQLVVIGDPQHCPLTFVSMRSLGCILPYQGNALSMNSSNDTFAATNSSLQVEESFCVKI